MKGTGSNKVVWSAADYASNSAVQQTWARELIAQLKLQSNERILDLGCGDGKVTAELARSVPHGSVMGVDASPQMIDFANKTFPARKIPNVEFQVMDARRIAFQRKFDLVFSNAALHWVDDHQAILRGAASVLRPGGRLVVSCGGKGNAHDVFLALRPEMRLKRWREFFRNLEAPYFFHSPEEYKKWLPRFGFKTHSVKLTPKDATYEGREGFAAWLRTTWLPYTQRVPKNLREEFIGAIAERYLVKHPIDAKGLIHVRMMRLEIDALRM